MVTIRLAIGESCKLDVRLDANVALLLLLFLIPR